MPALSTVLAALESLAPLAHAEPWDNVGLLVGDPLAEVSRVLFCIDLTLPVLAEAASLGCQLVVAYHPPIFEPQKSFRAGNIAFESARRGIAIYSPHTALDVAAGGTNDTLAAALGLVKLRPLKPSPPQTSPAHAKLVTYVPTSHADSLAAALFSAGAGHIGNYSHCSFRSSGTGTFFGQPGTHPTIGTPGTLESAPEIRLETVLPAHLIPDVLAALRSAHPYEEPAFDLLPLLPTPSLTTVPSISPSTSPSTSGIGRIGDLPAPVPLRGLISQLKSALNLPHLLLSGDPSRTISTIALCAGAGRSLLPELLSARPDLYLTGELPHHEALKLQSANIATLLTLHSNSERPALPPLALRLQSLLPTLIPLQSTTDHDPLTVV